jgi:hypothetical protein
MTARSAAVPQEFEPQRPSDNDSVNQARRKDQSDTNSSADLLDEEARELLEVKSPRSSSYAPRRRARALVVTVDRVR